MMPFFIFRIIVIATKPIRYFLNILPFSQFNDIHFAAKILCWNETQTSLIVNQSSVESGGFKSFIYLRLNNAFCLGIDASGNKRFPSIGTYNPRILNPSSKEPIMNVYRFKEDSVYSLIYMYKQYNSIVYDEINSAPTGQFNPNSADNERYLVRFAQSLLRINWFGSNQNPLRYSDYVKSIKRASQNYKFSNYLFYGTFLITFYLFWWFYKFFRHLFTLLGFVKKEIKGTGKAYLQTRSTKFRQKIIN